MRITALEGPSFAGKTSTLAALRPRLSAMTVITYGCYVDEISDVDDIPPARTRGAAEQLAAFELFMRIEALRVADLRRRPRVSRPNVLPRRQSGDREPAAEGHPRAVRLLLA